MQLHLKSIKLVKCSVHSKGKEKIRDASCYKSEPDTPVSQLTFASAGVLMNS